MIKSMTGFGRGEFADETSKVTVEIRAVNHRYLDIYVKMPRKYAFAEETIKAAIKEKLYRGKVEVSFSIDDIGQSDNKSGKKKTNSIIVSKRLYKVLPNRTAKEQ